MHGPDANNRSTQQPCPTHGQRIPLTRASPYVSFSPTHQCTLSSESAYQMLKIYSCAPQWESLEMNDCLQWHVLTRDKLLYDIRSLENCCSTIWKETCKRSMTLHCSCNKHVSLNNVLITFQIEVSQVSPPLKKSFLSKTKKKLGSNSYT